MLRERSGIMVSGKKLHVLYVLKVILIVFGTYFYLGD